MAERIGHGKSVELLGYHALQDRPEFQMGRPSAATPCIFPIFGRAGGDE